MKKSQIALLILLGLVVLFLLAGLVLARVAVGKSIGQELMNRDSSALRESIGEYQDKSFDLKNFSELSVEGFWTVKVVEGTDYAVELSIPESWNGDEVFVKDDQIVFGYPDNRRVRENGASAVVTMPKLKALHVEGAASVRFDGFECDNLDISIEGAARIQAVDSSARRVSVTLEGTGSVDLEDLKSVDAYIDLDGLGSVILNMAGGDMSGRIDGMGDIRYVGEVSSRDVVIDGMGTVRQME